MAIHSDDVALSTTAAVIWTATAGDANQPQSVTVQSNQAIVVTVGGPDVADASNGVVLPDGSSTPTSITVPMYLGDELYAISASGTPSVQILVNRK
jgi:hypothetical protein